MFVSIAKRKRMEAGMLPPHCFVLIDDRWREVKSMTNAGKNSIIIETNCGRFVRKRSDMMTFAYEWDIAS